MNWDSGSGGEGFVAQARRLEFHPKYSCRPDKKLTRWYVFVVSALWRQGWEDPGAPWPARLVALMI